MFYNFQADQRGHDPHLQLRGQRRSRQPGQDDHHHRELRVRGPGPVSDQHEVGGGVWDWDGDESLYRGMSSNILLLTPLRGELRLGEGFLQL